MLLASRLGGFYAAHAIWTLSGGRVLYPILAYTDIDNQQKMMRIITDDLGSGVAAGEGKLKSNDMDANDAVLLYDGRITISEEKMDALLIEFRCYAWPDSEALVAIPYTPHSTGVFKIHRPKLLKWQECEDFDMDAFLEAFWEGVDQHEQGAPLWEKHLDDSK
jgi:hypothetical protein